jgi:toxin YoeB
MRRLVFDADAFDDFADWGIYNRNVFKRIYELLKDIRRHPFEGIGKPESLKGDLKGYWSRRITDEHRLIYRVESDELILIISVRGHYGDN